MFFTGGEGFPLAVKKGKKKEGDGKQKRGGKKGAGPAVTKLS